MYTCGCGETFSSTDDLDAHFLDVFTPPDDMGTDGQRHYEAVTAQAAHDSGDSARNGVRM